MTRFELARDRADGSVCIFFMGRTIVPEGAALRIEGNDALLDCGDMELAFRGLLDDHLEWLASAPAIYVNRTLDVVDHMVQVRLLGRA